MESSEDDYRRVSEISELGRLRRISRGTRKQRRSASFLQTRVNNNIDQIYLRLAQE
jgi:hypothetical protein